MFTRDSTPVDASRQSFPCRRTLRPLLSSVCPLLTFAVLTPALLAKNVTATYTIGGKTYSETVKLDGGATGTGASELTREAAKRCGLIKDDGSFDTSKFQTNPDGSLKKVKGKQADGTKVEYAISKPIEIEATDDKGAKCKVSIPITVICNPAKTGTNLLGRDWGKLAKVTETWADDKATWRNPGDESKNKKTKTAKDSKVVSSSDFEMKLWDKVNYFDTFGGATSQDTFLMLSSPFSILSDDLATTLGLISTGSVDLSGDAQLLDSLSKFGFYTDTAPSFGLFNTAVVPSVEILTDDLTSVLFAKNIDVLINPCSDQSLFGRAFFIGDLETIDGIPLQSIGYLHETQEFFFTPVPEPSAIVVWTLVAVGFVTCSWLKRRTRPNRICA